MTRKDQIAEILTVLKVYWQARPELRLGQIISNMSVAQPSTPFHLSDVDLVKRLREQLGSKYVCMHPGTFRGEVCQHCMKVAR